MTRLLAAALAAALFPLSLGAQSEAPNPFDVWALNRLARISDPQLAPDGSKAAFTVTKVFVSSNRRDTQIYTVAVDGGSERLLTFQGETNERPRWSPDSREIAFISDRSGSKQIWLMDADGSNQRQLTRLSTEASGVKFSPDGANLIFVSRVFPDCGADDACNEDRLQEQQDGPLKARLYDKLLYRHWDQWADGRRSHLFVVGRDGSDIRELTPGPYDVPPFSLGGPDAYDISPDGYEVCFAMAAADRPSISTNTDLYVVPVEGGERILITAGNPAADTSPLYSPDGSYIAYRAQARPNYESDRYRLMVYSRASGETVDLTATLDRWVTGVSWHPDSTRLFFTAEDRGRQPIYTVSVSGGGTLQVVSGDAYYGDVQLSRDGRSILYTGQSGSHPVEIYRGFSSGGPPQQLTHLNDQVMNQSAVSPLEEVSYQAPDGTQIFGFEVKPPDFNFERQYPLLVLIHGGPQGAWGQKWSYRWNPQVFAGAGFVVFMPNPRGSTGYGQSFIDGINRDWGGKVFDDIMAGVDHMVRLPYIDQRRMAAAGASYGGYMINWMLGRTSRFRAFVSHAGVFDLRSMFGATEEHWFPLWEFRGAPWDDPEIYERWSPSNSVKNFRTPTLVVHGQKDYRVPVTQGMQLFSALQLQGVPSEFLYFPDEGHWIQKPRNSIYWHENVIGWLKRWVERPLPRRAAPIYEIPADPEPEGGGHAATSETPREN